jgi:15-cis-phytoene synthase
MTGKDTNFYYSFLVLPPAKRRAIVAVWEFCRAVDDAVDEATGEHARQAAATALARWRDELARCYDGEEAGTAQGRRLVPYIAMFGLPRRAFEDVIDGVEMDLTAGRYDTFEALREYCRRVASAVGLICVEIFGYRDARTRDYAVELGIALQLTNIIRDVAVDLGQGRLYLPRQDLARFGCSEADLGAGVVTDKVRALLRYECDLARRCYARAEALLPARDARRLVAARIMGNIYFELLRAIERSGYDVFSRIIRVPRPRRAVIAATTWLATMAGVR